MTNEAFLYLFTNSMLFIALIGIIAHIGATISVKIAEILGFGDDQSLSYKLDNLYEKLEGGQAINVKEYLDEA
jgi:hypothetical protein